MSSSLTSAAKIDYPEDDGLPMADNTLQWDWCVAIKGGLEGIFADAPNVFVAGNLLWYPVEGNNTIRMAPDAMVALGRPKGRRGSYRQWEEGGIAPQVVFGVLSPGNRPGALLEKFEFYRRHGVQEYYIYDPDDGTLEGWQRQGDQLEPIANMRGWLSPHLNVRFDLEAGELVMIGPDGRKFVTLEELLAQRAAAEKEASLEKQRANREQRRADLADQRAEKEKQRREEMEKELERLRAQLRAPGNEPPH